MSEPENALSADDRLDNLFGGTDSNANGGCGSVERSLDDDPGVMSSEMFKTFFLSSVFSTVIVCIDCHWHKADLSAEYFDS